MKNKKYLTLLIVWTILLFNGGWFNGLTDVAKKATGVLVNAGGEVTGNKAQGYTTAELEDFCGRQGVNPATVQEGDVRVVFKFNKALAKKLRELEWTEQGKERQKKCREEIARKKAEAEAEAEKARQAEKKKKEYITMPEKEKFPLLSVQSKPLDFMKDIKSGVAAKWLEGYLLANKIEYKMNNDSSLIRAFYPGRQVDFHFYANALHTVEISLTQSVTGDAFVEKYRNAMGAASKVKKSIGEVERDEEIDLIGALRYSAAEKSDRTVFFGRNITLSVSSDRMVATASYRAIGKAELSDRVVIMLLDSSVSPTKKYDAILLDIKKQITKDKDSADLDGGNKIDKITLMDKRLYDYRVQKEKEIADENERKKKEAEKAKNAAALDF